MLAERCSRNKIVHGHGSLLSKHIHVQSYPSPSPLSPLVVLLTLIGPLTLLSASVTTSPFCNTSQPPSSLSAYTSPRTSGIASRHVSKSSSLNSSAERARATSDGQKVFGGCLVVRKRWRWLCRGELVAASEDMIFGEQFEAVVGWTSAGSSTAYASFLEYCRRLLLICYSAV
jgi:hypothetical protein